jgi:hypothetical protein
MLGLISMLPSRCSHPAAFGPEGYCRFRPTGVCTGGTIAHCQFVESLASNYSGPGTSGGIEGKQNCCKPLGPFVGVRCARVETDHLDVYVCT